MESEKTEVEELSEKIGELEELVKQNHRMTRTLYRRSQYSTVFSLVKWVVVIGFTIGAFYYIQPYLDSVMNMYSTISSFGGGSGGTSTPAWMNLLKNFR